MFSVSPALALHLTPDKDGQVDWSLTNSEGVILRASNFANTRGWTLLILHDLVSTASTYSSVTLVICVTGTVHGIVSIWSDTAQLVVDLLVTASGL